jgi:protein O-mannosyl-transferase
MFEKFIPTPRSARIFVFLFPLALYLNTLWNSYALDDSLVLTENSFVQQGWNGIKDIFSNDTFVGFFKQKKELVQGGRYRPLSLVTFAIELALGINNPAFSHFINTLLFALLCVVLYQTFIWLMQFFNIPGNIPLIAFIATLIYAFHPVHTEVVANIKGRDELLAILFLLLSFREYLRFLLKGKAIALAVSVLSFFLGLLSKENAITLIPITGFLILLKGKKFLLKGGIAFGFLLISAIFYLWLHAKFAGGFNLEEGKELMNNPFLFADNGEKLPTILFSLGWYIKLLILPHPLTFDYYPYHVLLVGWKNPLVWLSLLLYLMILYGVLYYSKRNPILSFFFAFFLITLLPLSNLIINVGTFMNERFLFLPSVAFSFILAIGITRLTENRNPVVKIITWSLFIVLLLFASVKTISRNRVWKDNFTLFLHDVNISSGSAKGNCMAGGILYEKAFKAKSETLKKNYLDQSIIYLQKSLNIYPEYIDALVLLGNAYHIKDTSCNGSITIYEKIIRLSPSYNLAYENLDKILESCDDPHLKIRGYKSIIEYRPGDYKANYEIGTTYGKVLQNMDSAIIYLQLAVEIRPDSELAQRDLGVAYAMGGQYELSLPHFEKALQINSDDPANYINLGITLRQLGFKDKADELFAKAESLKRTSLD